MKPENILQADLLDIVFDNRNKNYGAYQLRKGYPVRLAKAMSVMIAFVVAFAIIFYIQLKFFTAIPDIPVIPLTEIDLQQIKEAEPKLKEKPQPEKQLVKPVAQKQYVTPTVVDDSKADKIVTAIEDLNNRAIGFKDVDGDAPNEGEVTMAPKEEGSGEVKVMAPIKAPETTKPLSFAEVMPEFPGGMEAFRNFLLKNLRQPDDLEEGSKVVVKIKFVVDADGTIKEVNILASGGDLDKEVLRVINKMPKWKPGSHNGKHIPVYFTLPITFVGPES